MAGTPSKTDQVVSFEDRIARSTDLKEQLRWTQAILKVREEELALTSKYLREALDSLNTNLGRNEKAKGKAFELAATVAGLARSAGGLLQAAELCRAKVGKLLGAGDGLNPDVQAAIDARYRIQIQNIIMGKT
jgi:hypothetical protein